MQWGGWSARTVACLQIQSYCSSSWIDAQDQAEAVANDQKELNVHGGDGRGVSCDLTLHVLQLTESDQ